MLHPFELWETVLMLYQIINIVFITVCDVIVRSVHEMTQTFKSRSYNPWCETLSYVCHIIIIIIVIIIIMGKQNEHNRVQQKHNLFG